MIKQSTHTLKRTNPEVTRRTKKVRHNCASEQRTTIYR